MMFLSTVVLLCVLATAQSEFISSNKFGKKVSTSQRSLLDFVSDSFKSDAFVPKSDSAAKSLEGTYYSLTGSVYQNVYFLESGANDTSCSSLGEVHGIPVNLCTVNEGYSFKFQLTSDSCTGLEIQYFSDMFCQRYLGLSKGDSLSQGQCLASTKTYTPPGAFVKAQCTTSSVLPLLPNGINGEYFHDTNCTGRVASYSSIQLDKCIGQFDAESNQYLYTTFSCDGSVPTITDWANSSCSGVPVQSNSTESMCLPTTDDNTDDSTGDDLPLNPPPSASTTPFPTATQVGTATNIFCPAASPTMRPVPVLTHYPTASANQQVSFDIIQNLVGASAATLTSSETNLNVIKLTIANAMTGVSSAAVVDLVVTDVAGSRRLGASKSLQATGNIVKLSYTVSLQTVYPARQLTDQLIYAVYSGAFTTDLNANAQAAGATSLYDCSSTAATVPIDLNISFDDDSLSGGAIAGIVIGSVVGFLLIVAIVYFCWCARRPASPMSSHGAGAAGAKDTKAGVEL